MTIEISEKLFKDIEKYCELNELKVNEYIEDLLKKSFTVEKYGDRPVISKTHKKNGEPINETIKELINEPINTDTVEKTEETLPVRLTDVVVDYSKTEELKPVPPMITHEEIVEEDVKPQKKIKRKLN